MSGSRTPRSAGGGPWPWSRWDSRPARVKREPAVALYGYPPCGSEARAHQGVLVGRRQTRIAAVVRPHGNRLARGIDGGAGVVTDERAREENVRVRRLRGHPLLRGEIVIGGAYRPVEAHRGS